MIGETDETQIVLDALDTNWDTGVITKPTIAKKADYDVVDVANGDFVLGYPVTELFHPLDSARRYHKVKAEVALDIRTDDESDIQLIEGEVRRIIGAQRHSVNYFDDMIYLGCEAVLNYRKVFRTVHTVQLVNYGDSVVA